jgi:hypothetical protein
LNTLKQDFTKKKHVYCKYNHTILKEFRSERS